MLRTMITETPFVQTWVLQGKLTGQWAIDLKRQWMETKNARQGRKCIVNLEDVTSVDVEGETVLQQMIGEDVRVIVSRAYMKHVIESLNDRRRENER
jgi:ABC-type transporter Mla MlaB component